MVDQHRGGGFAVGTCDADHAQFPRWKALKTRRQVRQGEMQVSLQADVGDGKTFRLEAVAENDSGAIGNG